MGIQPGWDASSSQGTTHTTAHSFTPGGNFSPDVFGRCEETKNPEETHMDIKRIYKKNF